MGKFVDLTGKVFNRLTALEPAGKNKHGRYNWRCSCSCGNMVIVASRSLLNGGTGSCGCLSIKGKLLHGVGLYRQGKYTTSLNGKLTKERQLWAAMLTRCYDPKHHTKYPTYKGCRVSENFKDYQYFAEWCNNQGGFAHKGYQLDKDLLGDGRLYSEETCCFIPTDLNSYFRCNIKKFTEYSPGKFTTKAAGTQSKTFYTKEDAIAAYEELRIARIAFILERDRDILDKKVINFLEEYIREEKICDRIHADGRSFC